MQTHYHALGVSEQATPDAIRRAYRKLVLLTHPDRTTDPAAHQQFLRINEAYDVLSNPSRRQGYDALLSALRNPAPRVVVPVAPPSQPRPAGAVRRPRAAPINFAVYQRPVRLWGKILLVFALLIALDYYGPTYSTPAICTSTTVYATDTYVVRTTKGRFVTQQDPTEALARRRDPTIQLQVSLLFRFIRGARLRPAGPVLPLEFRHQALFTFTGVLLVAAALTQGRLLGDAGRVNAAIVASAAAVLVVLLLLRV